MCEECKEKWYTYDLSCPACRTVDEEYLHKLQHTINNEQTKDVVIIIIVYMCFVVCVFFLGRGVSIALSIGPTDYWCINDPLAFIEHSLLGSAIVIGALSFLGLLIVLLLYIYSMIKLYVNI